MSQHNTASHASNIRLHLTWVFKWGHAIVTELEQVPQLPMKDESPNGVIQSSLLMHQCPQKDKCCNGVPGETRVSVPVPELDTHFQNGTSSFGFGTKVINILCPVLKLGALFRHSAPMQSSFRIGCKIGPSSGTGMMPEQGPTYTLSRLMIYDMHVYGKISDTIIYILPCIFKINNSHIVLESIEEFRKSILYSNVDRSVIFFKLLHIVLLIIHCVSFQTAPFPYKCHIHDEPFWCFSTLWNAQFCSLLWFFHHNVIMNILLSKFQMEDLLL